MREKKCIPEARNILLHAERAISEPSPLLDYNLACYFCLLGELDEARRRECA